jgi:riboflavin biosynthesis pyrimidine reductase
MAARKSTAKTSTAKAQTPVKTKGAPKPQAVADELDLTETVDGDALQPQPRRSKWTILLDKLYAATLDGKIPRSEDESLQFIKLGSFTNINGARTQARVLEKKGLDETYEFKSITVEGGSQLWGRVIEVEA